MLLVQYFQKSDSEITKSARVEFPLPKNTKDHDRLVAMLQEKLQLGNEDPITLVQVDKIKAKPIEDEPDQVDRNSTYRAGKQRENARVQDLPTVTWGELRQFLGESMCEKISELFWFDEDPVDPQILIERYSGEGGLTRFLTELFPASTSKKPYGPYQLRSIATCESVIRAGGVQQSLEPRSMGKSSRVGRAAIWALIFGFRKCCVCFQSSQRKSRQTVERVAAELCGNIALRAMFPKLCSSMIHARMNLSLQKKQHIEDRLTNVQLMTEAVKLPTVYREDGSLEPYSGGRLFAMPFGKAAGLSLVDADTLADVRPDLLLADDVQSHDDALRGASPKTKQLVDIWNESLRYLGGRDKAPATFFCQTIVREGDFASQLEQDPTIQTIKYGLVIRFSDNEKWWLTTYRDVLLDYDPMDPGGQAKASERARQLYLDNREMADAGSEVAWEFAYDPEKTASPLEQAYRNLTTNSSAFWSQDQNCPSPENQASDIRCKPSDITRKQHAEPQGVLPDFCDRLVAHIDVHDHLLYCVVAGGDSDQRLAIIDYFTWPRQSMKYYSMESATNKFNSNPEYMRLPTTDDRIRHGINTLVDHLVGQTWSKADGTVLTFDAIGVDCGDGMDLIHAIVRDSKHSVLIPTRGVSMKPTDTKLNERPKKPNEKKRGDSWIEKRSERTRQLWVEFDSSYYKYRVHNGLLAPLGTSHSISLFNANEAVHTMFAEHCNAEKPDWVKAESKSTGCWVWKKLPNDNHFFDCCVNATMLINRDGASFLDVGKPKQRVEREYVDVGTAWSKFPELYE